MRKDVNILINSKTSQVMLNQRRLGLNYENLQGKIIVTFDDNFVDGIAYLEIERNGEKGYLLMTKENESYTLEIKSSLLNKVGQINMQVRITEQEEEQEIPVWKSNIFYLNVEKAINSTTEIPDEYPSWIDTANTKIQEMDNLNIEAEKVGHTTTITITNKDGTETSVEVNDGEPGSPGAPGPKGDTGSQGPAGENGRDGAIQYTAGDNIVIENNTISADLTSKQDIIQYATLPSPSAEYLGKIFQYTGATDNTYTNGYFYQVVSDGGQTPTYSWSEIEFGGGTTSDAPITTINLVNGYYMNDTELDFNSDLQLIGEKLLEHYNNYGNRGFIYFKNPSDRPYEWQRNVYTLFRFKENVVGEGRFWLAKPFEEKPQAYSLSNSDVLYYNFYYSTLDPLVMSYYSPAGTVFKSLTTNNEEPYTPTYDYNPATKKYVDEHSGGSQKDYVEVLYLSMALMGNFTTFNRNSLLNETNKTIFLKFINDAIENDSKNPYFVNNLDDYYLFYKLIIPSDTTGTQSARILMYPNPNKLEECKVGDLYYISKTINITFTNNVATDIAVPSSGYTTQTWRYLGMGNTNYFAPSRDYEPSTKKYVDDSIAAIPSGGGDFPIAYLDNPTSNFQPNNINDGGTIDSDDINSLMTIGNDMLSKGFKTFILVVHKYGGGTKSISYLCVIGERSYDLFQFACIATYAGKINDIGTTMGTFYIEGTISNNEITHLDNYVGGGGNGQPILYANNTIAYTPTNDYNPATKKYVDDAIAAAIANLNS